MLVPNQATLTARLPSAPRAGDAARLGFPAPAVMAPGHHPPGGRSTLPLRAGRRVGGLFVALALLASAGAAAHDMHFTREQNAWLNRQRAVDGTKCCDETDAHVGVRVRWRTVAGRYEVMIAGAWLPIPPGRMMRHVPDDPSPWGGEALLFYTPTPVGPQIWCFSPEPLT